MKNAKQKFERALVALFMIGSVALFGCNSNSGGSGSSVPGTTVIPLGNCASCGSLNGGTLLLNAVQATTPDGTIQFTLNVTGAAGFQANMPNAIDFYSGPATFSGNMHVAIGGSPTFCGIPAGDYSVQPLQISNFSSDIMYGGSFQAIGPNGFNIYFGLSNAIFYNPDGLSTNSANNRANLTLILNSVNGISCGFMSTY